MHLDFDQVITQIIAFLLMLFVLKKFGWSHFLNLLDKRKQKIQSEFDSIAAEHGVAQAKIAEYEEKLKGIEAEARQQIQEAVAQGRKIAQEMQEEAQAHAKEILKKALSEMDNEIGKAKSQLKKEMVTMVIATTEKMLQHKLNVSEHKNLIAEFINEAKFK